MPHVECRRRIAQTHPIMNHIYATAFGLFCSLSLSAQTLNSGSVTPVPGDVLSYSSSYYAQP